MWSWVLSIGIFVTLILKARSTRLHGIGQRVGGPGGQDGSFGLNSTGDQASQGGPGGQVVRVVRVVRLDDMLSENIRFSCPKSSNN